MDRDVELSMIQAHDKWLTKAIVGGILLLGFAALGTFSLYEHIDKTADVQKAALEAQKAHDDAMKAMWDKQPAPAPKQ